MAANKFSKINTAIHNGYLIDLNFGNFLICMEHKIFTRMLISTFSNLFLIGSPQMAITREAFNEPPKDIANKHQNIV